MFTKIFGVVKRAERQEASSLPQLDPKLSLAALMVRVAKIDGTYNLPEITTIDKILCRRFDLNGLTAAQLRASGETLEREMPQTDVLGKVILADVPAEDLSSILADVWAVVLSDAVENPAEAILIERVETLIETARLASSEQEPQTGTNG